jgi:hypothetical protein
MARVFGGAIGTFRGKFGKLSARIVEGDTILCTPSPSVRVSNDPKCVEVRQKFKVTIKFASNVNGLLTLHDIWKQVRDPKTSAFNTICKHNYQFSDVIAPTLNNIITPDNGFDSPLTTAVIANGKLTGTLAALSSAKDILPEEVNLSINAIICLNDPKVSGDSFYYLLSLSKEIANFNFSQAYNFEIDLSDASVNKIAKYNQKFIYLAVASKSADNKVIKYSKSYALIST